MLSEIELWKTDLVKTANSLLRRIVQKKWSQRSIFRMEKDIFLGFFTARKLIESQVVSSQVVAKTFELIRYPRIMLEDSELMQRLPYDTVPERQKVKLNIHSICNQFIHSWYIVPWGANGMLTGFFVTSDYERKKGIYMITLFQMVEILRLCAGRTGIMDKHIKAVPTSDD